MPNLKYPELFHLHSSGSFDMEHAPGAAAPHNGIYACACGHEAPAHEGAALPMEPHPGHPEGQPLSWRLVAAARRHDPAGGGGQPANTFISPPGWPPPF